MTLADQLKSLASPGVAPGAGSGKKRASFLFDLEESARFDKETIFGLASAGIDELAKKHEFFGTFKETLFHHQSIHFERLTLNEDDLAHLDKNVHNFLVCLSPHLQSRCAWKALEWLVQKYEVHHFNKLSLIGAFLPYHDTNLFVRIVQLINVEKYPSENLNWLLPIQATNSVLSRQTLISHLAGVPITLQVICDMVFNLVKIYGNHRCCRAFVNLYSLTILGILSQLESGKKLQKFLSFMMPYFLKSAKTTKNNDLRMTAYIHLSFLATKFRLSDEVIHSLLKACISNPMSEEFTEVMLSTILCLLVNSPLLDIRLKMSKLLQWSQVIPVLAGMTSNKSLVQLKPQNLLSSVIEEVANKLCDDVNHYEEPTSHILDLLKPKSGFDFSLYVAPLMKIFLASDQGLSETPKSIVKQLNLRYPSIVEKCAIESNAKPAQLNELMASHRFKLIANNESTTPMFLAVQDASAIVRKLGLEEISRSISQLLGTDRGFVMTSLNQRLSDDDPSVAKLALSIWTKNIDRISKGMTYQELANIVTKRQLRSLLKKSHLAHFSDSRAELMLLLLPYRSPNAELPIPELNFPCDDAKQLAKLCHQLFNKLVVDRVSATALEDKKETPEKLVDLLDSQSIQSLTFCAAIVLNSIATGEDVLENQCRDFLVSTLSWQVVTASNCPTSLKLTDNLEKTVGKSDDRFYLEGLTALGSILHDFLKDNRLDPIVWPLLEIFGPVLLDISRQSSYQSQLAPIANAFVKVLFRESSLIALRFVILIHQSHPCDIKATVRQFIPMLSQVCVVYAQKHLDEATPKKEDVDELVLISIAVAMIPEMQPVYSVCFAIMTHFSEGDLTSVLVKTMIDDKARVSLHPNELSRVIGEVLSTTTLSTPTSARKRMRPVASSGTAESAKALMMHIISKVEESNRSTQTSLLWLRLIKGVSPHVSLPLLERYLRDNFDVIKTNDELIKLVASMFSTFKAVDVLRKDDSMFKLFCGFLCCNPGTTVTLCLGEESVVFGSLSDEQQISLLCGLAALPIDHEVVLSTLATLHISCDVILALLDKFSPQLTSPIVSPARGKHKRPVSKSPDMTCAEGSPSRLNFAVSLLARLDLLSAPQANWIPGIVRIFRSCFAVLQRFPQNDLLVGSTLAAMTNLLRAAVQPAFKECIAGVLFDVECILKILQTQPCHQKACFVVLSKATTLFPRQVLNSAMNIVVFVGHGLANQDDAHSVILLQTLLRSILAANQNVGDQEGSKLANADDLLQILQLFVATDHNIPKHRRSIVWQEVIDMLKPQIALALLPMIFRGSKKWSPATSTFLVELATSRYKAGIVIAVLRNSLKTVSVALNFDSNQPDSETELLSKVVENLVAKHDLGDSYAQCQLEFVHNLLCSYPALNDFFADQVLGQTDNATSLLLEQLLGLIQSLSSRDAESPILEKCYQIFHALSAKLSPQSLLVVCQRVLESKNVSIVGKTLEIIADMAHILGKVSEIDNILRTIADKLKPKQSQKQDDELSSSIYQGACFAIKRVLAASKHLINCGLLISIASSCLAVIDDASSASRSDSLSATCIITAAFAIVKITPVTASLQVLNQLMNVLTTSLWHPSREAFATDESILVLLTCVSALTRLFDSSPALIPFLSPHLPIILTKLTHSRYHLERSTRSGKHITTCASKCAQLESRLLTSLQPRIILPAIASTFDEMTKEAGNDDVSTDQSLRVRSFLFDITSGLIEVLGPDDLISQTEHTFSLILAGLTACAKEEDLTRGEAVSQSSVAVLRASIFGLVCTIAVRLSESSLRPQLFRVIEWFKEEEEDNELLLPKSRVLLGFLGALAKCLSSLFYLFATPFYRPVIGAIKLCAKDTASASLVVQGCNSLGIAFSHLPSAAADTLMIHTDFQCLLETLLSIVESYASVKVDDYHDEVVESLASCLGALSSVGNENWKLVNLGAIALAQSPEAGVRRCVCKIVAHIATRLGQEYEQALPDTLPYLAELLDDDDGPVEKEARKTLAKLEDLLGQDTVHEYF